MRAAQPYGETMAEYRIDELARAAGTTTRNVRAYQDRGLLPAPVKHGRVGIYTDAHLARLRLITSLLNRGYATAQITELLTSWEQGKDLSEVLGLEQAVTSPWTDEIPTYLSTSQARELLAAGGDDLFDRVVRLGVLQPEGDQCRVPSPQLLNTFAEVLGHGFTMTELISLYERIQPAIDSIARHMVETGAARLVTDHGETWLPEGQEITDVTAMLQQLRQLAMSSVQGILAHAMERHVEDILGEHLARVLKHHDG